MRWLVALLLLAADGGATAADLEVEVRGLAGERGTLWVSLHDGPHSFPNDYRRAARRARVKVVAAPQRFTFEGVPYGEYAVSVFHDENDNRRLDRGLLGRPLEGYGVSRNALAPLADGYEGAKFRVDRPQVRQVVVLQH